MRINELAETVRTMIYWYTPQDTGNLARSIGSVEPFGVNGVNAVGFIPFNENQSAPYGALLNELPTISYKIRNLQTGIVYKGSYANKHYKWCDNFADAAADILPQLAPIRRVQ